MAVNTIYSNGVKEILVPATESIAISNYGGGIAKIYYLIRNANRPNAYKLQQTLENNAVTLGAFSSDTTVKIEANRSTVIYEVGTAPDTGIGNADRLGGELPSYYAVDAETAKLVGGNDFNGTQKNISGVPSFQNDESDTLTSARFTVSGGIVYLRCGSAGAYENGSGLLRFTGWGVTEDIGSLTVRSGGANQTIYHTGLNPSLGDGNTISGTFTTSDAKTVTVTNGIITSIV